MVLSAQARVRVPPILPGPRAATRPGLPHAGGVQPLIVTLALDDEAQARFDGLRRAHFPRERNHLSAHVTLFHALPGEQEPVVREALREQATRPPFHVRVAGLRSLGRGVAYSLESPELAGIRQALASRFAGVLTPQDRQPHRPHVTVQNKVDAVTARALLADLQRDFASYDVIATGLVLWRYLGPTWERLAVQAFSGAQ